LIEIQSLLKRARKYLRTAGILITEKDYESSVSRSYYAMFYSAEAALLSKGLTFSSHKGVLSAFSERFVRSGIFPKEMSKELYRAFGKRQLGDYEYTFVIEEEEAREILKSAKFFVNNIARYLK
jgi:uncharacterized protein (UPF0332 family)